MAKPYSVVADIRTQTAFKDDSLITDTYITQKIAEADDIIDSVIGEVYVLPLDSNPNSIVSLSKSMTSCLLYQEQNINFEVEAGVPVNDFCKSLLDRLEAIRTRLIKLYDDDGDELTITERIKPQYHPTVTSSEESATDSTAPKFSMNKEF